MFDFLRNLLRFKTTSKNEKAISVILAFGFVFLMGYVGNYRPDKWYEALEKPDAVPPDQVFSVVWIILLVLLGYSMFRVWNYYESNFKRRLFALLYLVNGGFIFLWSYLFFGQHNLAGAFYTIIGMVIIAELMIITAFHNNKKAAYILIPYLLWILFETYLNATIIILN